METHVRELVAVMHKTWKCINLDSGDIWLLDVGLLTDNHGKQEPAPSLRSYLDPRGKKSISDMLFHKMTWHADNKHSHMRKASRRKKQLNKSAWIVYSVSVYLCSLMN